MDKMRNDVYTGLLHTNDENGMPVVLYGHWIKNPIGRRRCGIKEHRRQMKHFQQAANYAMERARVYHLEKELLIKEIESLRLTITYMQVTARVDRPTYHIDKIGEQSGSDR